VKSFLSITVICLWWVAALQLSGCGNTGELEKTIVDKNAAIDKLESEKKDLQAENGRLRTRIVELENNLKATESRAAGLQRQVDELRERLNRETPPVEPGDMEGAYREALKKFMDGRYEDAVRDFQALLAAGIPDPLNDNCHYWIGESWFGLKRYTEALASFDEVLAFEWSNKKDDSQVMIARCYGRMGDLARAQQEYRKLMDVYPASPYLELARRRAGAM